MGMELIEGVLENEKVIRQLKAIRLACYEPFRELDFPKILYDLRYYHNI